MERMVSQYRLNLRSSTRRVLKVSPSSSYLQEDDQKEKELTPEWAERDEIVKELNSLAVRLQKNGGVDIRDRKWGSRVWTNCFKCSDLVKYVQATFGMEEDLSRAVCYELWVRGLIYHVLETKRMFMDSDELFFRVAHPYVINSLLLPSEMEKIYEKSRGLAGPRMLDQVINGKMHFQVFSARTFLEWLIHLKQYKRKKAIQITQQMIFEGYYYIVSNSAEFQDSDDLFLQSRHNYVDNVNISKELGMQIAALLAAKMELEPPSKYKQTVGHCITLLQSTIVDCSRRKAMHILKQLIKTKRLLLTNQDAANGGSSSENPADIVEYEWLINGEEGGSTEMTAPNGPGSFKFNMKGNSISKKPTSSSVYSGGPLLKGMNGLKSPNTKRKKSLDITAIQDLQVIFPMATIRRKEHEQHQLQEGGEDTEKTIVTRQIDVDVGRNQLEIQKNNIQLISFLGLENGSSHGAKKIFSVVRCFLYILMCIMLWVTLLESNVSFPNTSRSIKAKFESTDGFESMSKIDHFLEYANHSTLFDWTANQFVHLVEPRVKLLYSKPVSCMFTFGETELFVENNDCFENNENDFLGENLFMELERSDQHYFLSQLDEIRAIFDVNQTARETIEIFVIKVSVISMKTSPHVIVLANFVGRIGAFPNRVLVDIVPLIDPASISWMHTFLLVLATMSLLDQLMGLLVVRKKFSLRHLAYLARVVLIYVGVVHYNNYVAMVDEFLSEKKEFYHETIDILTASNICFIFAMLLSTMSLPGQILGTRYNIFEVLGAIFGSIAHEARVLALTAFATLMGFSLANYSLMRSRGIEFRSVMATSRTLLGGLFGGSPWSSFRTDDWNGYLGWTFTIAFLVFFIFILMNIFVATLVRSYTRNKQQEDEFANELKKHMHLSVGRSGIDSVLKMILKRIEDFKRTDPDFEDMVDQKGIIVAVHEKLMEEAKVKKAGENRRQSIISPLVMSKSDRTFSDQLSEHLKGK